MNKITWIGYLFCILLAFGCDNKKENESDDKTEDYAEAIEKTKDETKTDAVDTEKEPYSENENIHQTQQFISDMNGGLLREHPTDGGNVLGSLPYGIKVYVTKELIDNSTGEPAYKWVSFEGNKGWVAASEMSEQAVDQLELYETIWGKLPDNNFLIGPWLKDYPSLGKHFYEYFVFNQDGTYYEQELSAESPSKFGTWSYKEGKLTLDDGYYNSMNNKDKPMTDVTIRSFFWENFHFYKLQALYGPGRIAFVNTEKTSLQYDPKSGSELIYPLEGGMDVLFHDTIPNPNGKTYARVTYQNEVGYVLYEYLTFSQPSDYLYIDINLLPSFWSVDGEGFILTKDHKWNWEGPEAEEDYGTWVFDKSTNMLTLNYALYPDQKQEYLLTGLTTHWMKGKRIGSEDEFMFRRDVDMLKN